MEGAAQLVSTVGQLVGEEYRTLRSVGGQVAELRDELDTMNAVLRMQSEADDGSVDHFVRVWMNQTAALHDLRARAVVISELHARYGLSREVLSRSASLAPAPRATTHALRASNDPDQFVGISDQAKLLAAKVEKMDVNKERKVFSIVGFGGLGKTTLAMEVCRQLEAMFERQAQVSVSQTFDGRKDLQAFLKRMLQQIVKYIFPEDYVVFKDRLLHRWIAEGLVEEKRGLTSLEVAEGYYKELMSRNMINPAPFVYNYDDGGVETCRVHDMILEVMVSKSLEANFVSLVGGQYGGMSYDKIRRLSIHGVEKGAKDLSPPPKKMAARRHGRRDVMEGMNLKHVRSFSMFELEGHKLLDRLDEFTLLRVLDLEGCSGLRNKHLRDICRMYLLKFLSIRGTDIRKIPPSVGDLEHLQMLDARDTYLRYLPKTVTNLEKLERLLFSTKDTWLSMWQPPSGISRMKALREVNNIVIRDNIQVAIGDLEGLQGIVVHVNGDSEIREELRKHLAASLCRTNALRWLNVGDTRVYGDNNLDYLMDLRSPPQLLQYLRFDGGVSRLPDWVGSLSCLVEFCMSYGRLKGDQPFAVLCKAPNLRIIRLHEHVYSGDKLVARTAHNFPALKEMRVSCHNEFPSVFSFQEGSMTKLETLELNFYDNQKSIEGVEHFKKLKEVQHIGWKNNSAINQVAELRDELDTMNAVLRMQSDADDGSVDHFVRVWMNQTAALHDRLAGEIRDLRARAVIISEHHARYGLSREVLSRSAPLAPAPRATTHALRAANDPKQFVGISDQAKLLAAKVEKMDVNKERKVFSVVGFGGLGKTTLAMEVCRQLEAMFDRQAQVSVSQTFGRNDLQALLKRVLQQVVKVKPDKEKGIKEEDSLTPGDIDKMDLDGLTSTIEEKLMDKRYE
ncbi:hypothetical protein ACQ4PT_051734 [Festuca glaucescens]